MSQSNKYSDSEKEKLTLNDFVSGIPCPYICDDFMLGLKRSSSYLYNLFIIY